MRLLHTIAGPIVELGGKFHRLAEPWDELINQPNLREHLAADAPSTKPIDESDPANARALRPPIGSQEVWAAGVTYYRSRDARMEESQQAGGGGGSFYDRVYSAARPELFFKATPHRVVGPGAPVRIR